MIHRIQFLPGQTLRFFEAAIADPVPVFTLCLVLVGIARAILFFVQLRLMQDGIDDASITTKVAQASAAAAKDQVALTKMGAKNFERANLSVGPAKMTNLFTPQAGAIVYCDGDSQQVAVKLSVNSTWRTSATIRGCLENLKTDEPNIWAKSSVFTTNK